MSTDRWMRASDEDRETALEVLGDAYAVGRLNREEFDERSGAAYSARTWGELDDITADLPELSADPSLPSDIVSARGMDRSARRRPRVVIVWMFALVLAAGLGGRVFPAAAWAAGVLASLMLALPFVLRGASRRRANQDR